MEQRCGTCKHWVEYNGWRDPVNIHALGPEPDYDAQSKEQERVSGLYRQCQAIEANPEVYFTPGEALPPLPKAVAIDGSAYMADVFTQAEFGCVLWEAAP